MINSVWETHLYSSFYIKINTSCPVGFIPVLVTSLSLPCIHMCSHDNPSLHYVSLRGNLLINFFYHSYVQQDTWPTAYVRGYFNSKFSFFPSSLAVLQRLGVQLELTESIACSHQTSQNLELQRVMPSHDQWTELRSLQVNSWQLLNWCVPSPSSCPPLTLSPTPNSKESLFTAKDGNNP